MKAGIFSGYILLLFFMVSSVFYHFRHHFSGLDYYKAKTAILQKRVEQEKLNTVLSRYQHSELMQHVARVIPGFKRGGWKKSEEGFPLRNLASVVGVSGLDKIQFAQGSSSFEQAKTEFRQGHYSRAILQFKEVIENYPHSVHAIKARFLLVECFFRQQRYHDVIEIVDEMVTQFPESEMTGFAMLRLASVFEHEERPEDAVDIYNVIIKNYSDKSLRKQAQLQLREVHL